MTAAHRELIKILAAQAVEEFSNESEHKKMAAPCATGKRPKKGTQANDNRTPTRSRNKA